MKHICGKCLKSFSSEHKLNQHFDRCQKQQPTKITFIHKEYLKFEDRFYHHMKIRLPFRVFAAFECFYQPQKDRNQPKLFFEQIAMGSRFHSSFTIRESLFLEFWMRLCELVCKPNIHFGKKSKANKCFRSTYHFE